MGPEGKGFFSLYIGENMSATSKNVPCVVNRFVGGDVDEVPSTSHWYVWAAGKRVTDGYCELDEAKAMAEFLFL